MDVLLPHAHKMAFKPLWITLFHPHSPYTSPGTEQIAQDQMNSIGGDKSAAQLLHVNLKLRHLATLLQQCVEKKARSVADCCRRQTPVGRGQINVETLTRTIWVCWRSTARCNAVCWLTFCMSRLALPYGEERHKELINLLFFYTQWGEH